MTDDRPPRPVITDAPGLSWREHALGWEARWRPRNDLVRRGYPSTVMRVWAGSVPTERDIAWITDRCQRQQAEMLAWGRGVTEVSLPSGTLRALIYAYQTDPDSTYHALRYRTREHYDTIFQLIAREHGDVRLGPGYDADGHPTEGIKARLLHKWHQEWTAHRGVAMAHRLVTMLRILIRFGATYMEDPECERLSAVLHGMKFKMGTARHHHLTADQVTAIRAAAHSGKNPRASIALAQALQFECTLRQKDVIGEWVPIAEAGPPSDVTADGMKWLRGIRWSEIDDSLILRHTTSKRLKDIEVDLKLAPMVIEELVRQFGYDGNRARLPASGPVIVSESSKLPYDDYMFRRFWRDIATAAGVPKEVRNMDSRAGAITEATDAGAPLELVRHAAAHSNVATTARYSRGAQDKTAEVMRLRVETRNKK